MVNGQNKGILKNKMILAIAIFIVFSSIEAMAYNVNIDWTFNQNNYDVELYKCTSSLCNSYTSQLLSTFSPGYTYHMSYSAGAYQYHAAFFYKSCYRPMGYIIYNEGDFSTGVSDSFVKKNYCESVIDPLIVTTIQNTTGTYINITTDVKSAFTVSDDAYGSPKFYPSSHSDYFTSDVKVQMLVDGVLKSEQTVSLYQDTKQIVTFQLDKSTLTPGIHTIRIQTDPIDCICNQGNKYIRYRTVQVEIEQPANTPPTIEGLPDLNVDEDTGYWNALIDLWAYSYDNETPDDGLTYSITSQTNNAIIDCIIDHNRYIDCATLPNMNGCSDITVRVTDPQALYDEDTFRICIQPVNDAPDVSEIPNQTIDSCHQFTQFDLDDYVNDIDNSDSEIAWTHSGNNHISINISSQHVVTATYPSWFRGSETIRFTATDPHAASDYDDVTFTVTECQGENTPPTLDIPDQTYEEDSGMHTIDLWQYAQDNETPDDQLTFIIVNQTHPGIVNCVIRDNRFLDCTVQPNMIGYSDITVRVTDLGGLYDEDTFRITITEEEIEDDPEVAPSIQITRVIYDDNVMQGGYMHVNIYVQGNKVKNTEARITIPDLNIDEKFDRFKHIEIKIPEDAETGYHTMEIGVKSNHNEQDRVYEQFFVQPKETKQKTTYEADGIKTTGGVISSKYNTSQETILTLVAIALTITLIIVLIMIIATLTTKK